MPAEQQPAVVARVREEKLTAVETEKVVAELRGGPAARRAQRCGSSRRFAIGSAIVEVRFRKRDATDEDVLDVLERAARMARDQVAGDTAEAA